MRERRCQFENRSLSYRIAAEATGGRWLVCLGGLGGTDLIWSDFLGHLPGRYRVLIWTYPGLGPGEALDPGFSVDVPHLAACLGAVLDAEAIESACLVGWSLGAQVAIEFARSHGSRIGALVAVCGLAGQPFFDDPDGAAALAALDMVGALPQALGWLTGRMRRIEELRARLREVEKPTRWAKKLGLVDPVIDEALFDGVIKDFLSIDIDAYSRYTIASAEHDASDMLGRLGFPVLAVAGAEDRFIKPARVERMALAIPDCELYVARGATHYLPLEYGPLLALKTDDFLRRKGLHAGA